MEKILLTPCQEKLAAIESPHRSRTDFCRSLRRRSTAFVAETYGRLNGQPGMCISALAAGVQSFCFISRVCPAPRI